jgi:hypothetical protein
MERDRSLPLRIAGFRAVAEDGEPLGVVDGVGRFGLLLDRMPGFRKERGYVLAEAVSAIDDELDIVVLAAGVTPAWAALTPEPEGEEIHVSGDEWADRMGLLGLFAIDGTRGEPFLHPDGRL